MKVLPDGMQGLLKLYIEKCGATLERLREVHGTKKSVMDPILSLIESCNDLKFVDRETSVQLWTKEGVEEWMSIDTVPSTTFFQVTIYGEVFGPDFDNYITPALTWRPLSVETRL